MAGHKIFISYKYHDRNVYQYVKHQLFEERIVGERTPRDYVNVLETYIKDYSPHYYKAEEDDNDLSNLSEDAIWEILKDKIFDSTLTIVLVSPNMRELNKIDRDQWIPWEIQYSLGLHERRNSAGNIVRSSTNAMLAIVLPDVNGEYNYYFEQKKCCNTGCRVNKTNTLFSILRNNTFNLIDDKNKGTCNKGTTVYRGDSHSFISFYKWDEVNTKEKIEEAIKHAYEILSRKDAYKICHEID